MFDHLGIQVADVDASLAFYLTTFAPLGFREALRYATDAGPVVGVGGSDGFPHIWVAPRPDGAQIRHEAHIAFAAPERRTVDAVHEAALAAGYEILHAPRVWPEYHPGYYGTFIRDPDGSNVEAVHHTM